METNKNPRGRISFNVARKPYSAPSLVIYGKLIELTAAGSGHSNESHADITSRSYKPG